MFVGIAMLVATAVLFGCEDNDKPTPGQDQDTFEFAGVEVTHTSLKVNVLPEDKTMEYIVLFSEKPYFDDGSRDKLLESDYRYLSDLAKSYKVGLREFLSGMGWLVQGDKMQYEVINLYPDTDYVVYCYGVEFDEGSWDATTDICHVDIRTAAPEMKEVRFAIDAQTDGDIVTLRIDPKGYKDYWYACIVPETDDWYLPEGTEFGASYIRHYRNNTIDEFRKLTDEFAATFDDLCYKGVRTIEKRLEPNKEYMVIAFAVSGDQVPLLCSVPEPRYFAAGDAVKSDLVVDIEVADITAYSAELTLTPSNNDESYACVFISEDQVPDSENDYELMLDIIEYFQPAVFKGVHTESLPLTPLKEYVILAFGIDNDLPTTDLFRYDFTSKEAQASKITVESIDLLKLFDAAEIVALDDRYEDVLAEYECVAVVEMKTSMPTDKILMWWYEPWILEYSDEVLLEDLLYYDYAQNPELMGMYYSMDEEDLFFFAGVAEDNEGNLSPVYRGELFTLSEEDCAPAEEFFDCIKANSPNTFILAVKNRKSPGRR